MEKIYVYNLTVFILILDELVYYLWTPPPQLLLLLL